MFSQADFVPPSVIATEIARILSDRIVFLESAAGLPHPRGGSRRRLRGEPFASP